MPDYNTDTATTNFSQTVQVLISTKLEELLRAPLPHLLPDNFAKATFVPGTNGTARFINYPDITVDDAELTSALVVTEGEPNDIDELSIGYEEFQIHQYMKLLRFTDVVLLESPHKLMAVGADRLARYVLELMDRYAANLWLTGTNVIASGTSNTVAADVAAGDVLLSSDIKKAVALLEGGNVPRFNGDNYRGVIHPYVKFDVELDDDAGGWIDASRYAGSEQLFSGELGKYAGVRFMSSSKAGVLAGDGTGSIDVYSTTIFGPRFFALGDWSNNETFVTPPGGHDDPGHQSALLTWKGWLGGMIIGEGTSAVNVSEPRYISVLSSSSL